MTLAQSRISELSYGEILFGVIIAWVLVALWQRVVENTAYSALGLNPKSAFHALLVAVVATAIFLVLISTVDSIAQLFLVGSASTPSPLAPPSTPISTNASALEQDFPSAVSKVRQRYGRIRNTLASN